jgi:hypothetical protein
MEELVTLVRALQTTTESMAEQLKSSTATIADLSYRLTSIEGILKATQKENEDLKQDLANSYQEAKSLKTKLNNLEQHHRSWSVRVVGMKIPAGEETSNEAVRRHLYEKLIKPILEGAVKKNILARLPSEEEVLERAHVLPSKKDGPKPIIARFYCREIRALVFKLKKEFAPKEVAQAAQAGHDGRRPGQQTSRPRYLYQIFDDLTRANFLKMKAIGDDQRVEQCWAVNGQLRFKLVDCQEIKRVFSVYDTIDEILK